MALLVLAACSQQTTLRGVPPAPPDGSSAIRHGARASDAFASLYAFKGAPDGANPMAPLVLAGSTLYGTTNQGGTVTANGDGTVFTLPAGGGADTILHSFAATPDGQFPQSGLTQVGTLFYGTTPDGGANSAGAVYSIATDGTENVVYSFGAAPDGASPTAGLANVKGTLYGTTAAGGGTACNSGLGCGTIFKIDPAGHETVLYRFLGGSDGEFPAAGLLLLKGALYGTTFFGGDTSCSFRGCGTVYAIDPKSGSEKIVYAFKGGNRDGASPSCGLVAIKRMLYGTTSEGGKGERGTVFRVGPNGGEHVLHFFAGGKDGADSEAGLTLVNGTLYGTTFAGGSSNGFGTLFSITPDGTETVLHAFVDVNAGANPDADLLFANGVLFGTTQKGGSADAGTVFSYTP
jgi:uncharacterized repeat protein (TIGR03803 family)